MWSFIVYATFTKLVKVVIRVKKLEYIPNMTRHQTIEFARKLLMQTLEDISVIKSIDSHIDEENNHSLGIICLRLSMLNGETVMLFTEVLSSGERRNVKNAITKLEKTSQKSKYPVSSTYVAVMAPYISHASSQICKENGVGYLDFSGNCLLRHVQFHIEVEAKPNKYILKKSKRNYLVRSSVKVSKVIREMLTSPERFWQVSELVKITETSLGTVSNVKQFLLEKDWIIEDKKEFRIGKVGELLKEWAQGYNKTQNISYEYYSMESIPQLEKRMADLFMTQNIKCYLAFFAAAVRYSPVVRYNKVAVYVCQEDFEKVVAALQLKEVLSGGNVSLIIPYNECVISHSREINGSFVTSPVQTVLDLYYQPGRGEEAAEAVIAKEYGKNE